MAARRAGGHATRSSSSSTATCPSCSSSVGERSSRLTEAEFLPGSLAFGIHYQQCFNSDPLLPPELLPRPWPGREARELVLTCRRLGVLLREEHDKPKLFAPWDDLLLSFRS